MDREQVALVLFGAMLADGKVGKGVDRTALVGAELAAVLDARDRGDKDYVVRWLSKEGIDLGGAERAVDAIVRHRMSMAAHTAQESLPLRLAAAGMFEAAKIVVGKDVTSRAKALWDEAERILVLTEGKKNRIISHESSIRKLSGEGHA